MHEVPAPVLDVADLVAGYVAEVNILNGLNLHVQSGEIVTVIGPNGAGKSTLMKAIVGLVPKRGGQICLHGSDITNLRTHKIVRQGLAYVPQTDNVFPSMSVEENLEIAGVRFDKATQHARTDRMYELFPQLFNARKRSTGLLSGGQRQMVAMARALMNEPDVLLLDEPSAGLAPEYVDIVFEKVVDIRNTGVTVLIVEQNARRALALSDRGYVLELGHTKFEGTGDELLRNDTVIELYLGRQAEEALSSAPHAFPAGPDNSKA